MILNYTNQTGYNYIVIYKYIPLVIEDSYGKSSGLIGKTW